MFVKLLERKVENGHLVIHSTKDTITENYAWTAAKATPNLAKLSEKSISIINNTLNKLFKQGLLNMFHSDEMKSVVIVTKNLSTEIKQCIQHEKYVQDITILDVNELPIDSKISMIIAFDFSFESFFFNELFEKTKRYQVPTFRFEIADQRIYMGPIFFTQKNPC